MNNGIFYISFFWLFRVEFVTEKQVLFYIKKYRVNFILVNQFWNGLKYKVIFHQNFKWINHNSFIILVNYNQQISKQLFVSWLKTICRLRSSCKISLIRFQVYFSFQIICYCFLLCFGLCYIKLCTSIFN